MLPESEGDLSTSFIGVLDRLGPLPHLLPINGLNNGLNLRANDEDIIIQL